MTSARRIRASRANGAKSRGPKTPEGKRRSAANSTRHGLLANTVVLEDENAAAFTSLLAAFERDLHPHGDIELSLVQDMAVARWRLLRLWAIERATLQSEMEGLDAAAHPPDVRAAMAFRALGDRSRSLDVLNRYESRFDRQYARALTLLMKLNQLPAAPESSFCRTNLIPNPDTPDSQAPTASSCPGGEIAAHTPCASTHDALICRSTRYPHAA